MSKYTDPTNIFLCARLKMAQKDKRYKNRIFTANVLGISPDALISYETGRRSPDDRLVIHMAEIYGDVQLVYKAFEQTGYGKYLKQLEQNGAGGEFVR